MGQSVADCYQVEELQGMAQSDALPAYYIWMDLKVNGTENKLYISKFKEEFQVEGQDVFEVFQMQVRTWNKAKAKLRVICAASLPDDVYRFIDSSDIIERAILFCGNRVRANNLMRDYAKIKKACFSYSEVIKTVKKWEKEGENSLLFFELQDMERMNKMSINIRALIDHRISAQQAREHYRKYLEKVMNKDWLDRFTKFDDSYDKLRNSITKSHGGKDALIRFFREHLVGTESALMSEVNKLLRCTFNPKKLAYLRLIISDLFNAIKDAYKEVNSQQITFTVIILFNEEELKRLGASVNRFITLTHFVETSVAEPSSLADLKESEIIVKIKVPAKKAGVQSCNGYLANYTKILLNLGNFFKVDSFEPLDRQLSLTLIQFDDNKLNLNNKLDWLQLNQNWITSQQQIYEGQLYALLIHDERSAREYINAKITSQHKDKNQSKEESTFKWLLSRENWHIKKGKPVQQIEKGLELIYPPTEAHQVMILLCQCQLYFIRKLDAKFRAAVKALDSMKEKVLNEEIFNKIKLFRLYDKYLSDQSTDSRQQVLKKLVSNEDAFSRQLHSLSYHLLLSIKIACFYGLKAYKEALELINQLACILSICEGTSSQGFLRLNQLKIDLMIRQNQDLNKQELLIKKKLKTSSIQRQTLKKSQLNDVYSIDASKLDFALYN